MTDGDINTFTNFTCSAGGTQNISVTFNYTILSDKVEIISLQDRYMINTTVDVHYDIFCLNFSSDSFTTIFNTTNITNLINNTARNREHSIPTDCENNSKIVIRKNLSMNGSGATGVALILLTSAIKELEAR